MTELTPTKPAPGTLVTDQEWPPAADSAAATPQPADGSALPASPSPAQP